MTWGYFAYRHSLRIDHSGPKNSNEIYCKEIKTSLDSVKIDTYLTIPNGKLAICYTTTDSITIDSFPPILIKLNKDNSIVWAVSLDTKSTNCEIPLFKMDNIRLVKEDRYWMITFFNVTYQEPGIIYLTENFDFDYMYLSPL